MIRYRKHRCNYIGTLGVIILCSFQSAVFSQLSLPGKPFPFTYENAPDVMIHEIVVTEEQRSQAIRNVEPSFLKPARSGLLLDVEYSPQNIGTWDTLPDGGKLWRTGFRVENAILMGLIFSPYRLNKGVKVFIYSERQENTLGAFTDLNNKQVNLLATAQVPGELMYVEMQVPAYLESYGSLGISGIGCDFSDAATLKTVKDGWFGWSGPCNSDVLCSDEVMVNRVKNSVVRIIFQGSQRCTGTLVNTTQRNGINYILTAGHCFTNEKDANTAVFNFAYESPSCGGQDGNSLKSVSGATIRARSDKVDFALLELLEPIPFTYKPYYAGWDISGQNPESGTVIHHPLGDVKKLGIENHQLIVGSYGSLYDDGKHWVVKHWESGTTEPGSSGAPIFDPSGLITGTLTGGMATCESSIRDYFQMISHSWMDYSAPDNQLAAWLDPLDLNQTYLNGYDPYADFWLTGDTLSNIGKEDQLLSEQGILEWGSYSGHNSSLIEEFAEKFITDSPKKMHGLSVFINKNYVSSNLHSMKYKVWSGSEVPQDVIYEKSVMLSDLSYDAINFIEFDSIVSVNQEFFTGYELNYYANPDTFSVYMAGNRPPGGTNTAYVNDGTGWNSLSEFTNGTVNSSFAVFPVVFESVPEIEGPVFEDDVIVYPNPASSVIRIGFREILTEPVRISIYNMQGQLVFDNNYGPYQHIIPISLYGISNGIYVIKMKQGNRITDLKVAVVK